LTNNRAFDERIRLTDYYSFGRLRSGFVHNQLPIPHELRNGVQDNVTPRSEAIEALIRESVARFERACRDHDDLNSMSFAIAMNALKLQASEKAVGIVQQALTITGIQGFKNDTPYSVGRELRDILSAPLMIANDRVLANTSTMLLMSAARFPISRITADDCDMDSRMRPSCCATSINWALR